MSSWETQLAKGKLGEDIVRQVMSARGHEVIDVSNDSSYWREDVDFIIANKKVELKTDYWIHKTDNIFLELDMMYHIDGAMRDGYFVTTEAEYLFYLDIKNLILYIYEMKNLKDYVSLHKPSIIFTTDYNKTISGYLLNKDKVKHQTIFLEEAHSNATTNQIYS